MFSSNFLLTLYKRKNTHLLRVFLKFNVFQSGTLNFLIIKAIEENNIEKFKLLLSKYNINDIDTYIYIINQSIISDNIYFINKLLDFFRIKFTLDEFTQKIYYNIILKNILRKNSTDKLTLILNKPYFLNQTNFTEVTESYVSINVNDCLFTFLDYLKKRELAPIVNNIILDRVIQCNQTDYLKELIQHTHFKILKDKQQESFLKSVKNNNIAILKILMSHDLIDFSYSCDSYIFNAIFHNFTNITLFLLEQKNVKIHISDVEFLVNNVISNKNKLILKSLYNLKYIKDFLKKSENIELYKSSQKYIIELNLKGF